MRVCSWNIWSKGSELAPRHWLLAARQLQEWAVDLTGLQEVDRHWGARSQHADVAGEMAEQLGFACWYCPSITDGERQYGNAVLSRHPILEQGRIELSPQVEWDPSNHETEPRTAAWVRVERPEPTVLITAHLANALEFASTAITRQQGRRLAGLTAELGDAFPGHQLILCGDFNLEPGCEELQRLEQLLPRHSNSVATWPVHPFTYKGWSEQPPPRFAVDHLFARRPMRVWAPASTVSDHLPLLAEGCP